jgi:hypothetical protein
MSNPKLHQITGIGPATAARLESFGPGTVRPVAEAPARELAEVPGFCPVRARAVRKAARQLLSSGIEVPAGEERPKTKGGGKGKGKGKRESGKKGKKGRKRKGKEWG